MNKSISKKISKITFALIVLVLLFSLLFQSLFFEKFYLNEKTDSLISNTNTLKTLYSYQSHNRPLLLDALRKYEDDNNCRVAIFSLEGSLLYLTNYGTEFDDLEILTNFCSELLNNKALIKRVLEEDCIVNSIFTDANTDSKKIGIVSPMSLKTNNDSIFVSVSSIQPIKEASSVIKRFYFYLFIGFLIVAIYLSKIYSILISKPLIKINNVAKKMSNFDFDAKCEVTSNDEIGNLAQTLNLLSTTLESALDDLKEKNHKLELDIEKERKLEKMRKDFVTNVSHDLKTPLGIISGYAEGLKDGVVSGDKSNLYLQTIIDETEKMNLLLTSMLELSKFESGTITLNSEEFNIVRMILNITKSFELSLQNKNIELEFINTPDFAYVYGDILKIKQVIQNLLSNAIKYTPINNKIRISYTVNTDNIEISILNTGVNIPPEELENIFVKFYRLDKSGDRSDNNFGLGLSIVKSILDLHNSTYSIKNTDEGVLFTFSLKTKDSQVSDF